MKKEKAAGIAPKHGPSSNYHSSDAALPPQHLSEAMPYEARATHKASRAAATTSRLCGGSPQHHRDDSSSLSSDVTNVDVMHSGGSSSSSSSARNSADASSLSQSFTSSASDDEYDGCGGAGKKRAAWVRSDQALSGTSTPVPPARGSKREATLSAAAPQGETTRPNSRRQRSAQKANRATARTSAEESRKDVYNNNLSHVIYGATSAILFVCVIFLCYATSTLIQPYRKSITSAVVLSIVLHPRSRLHSSLHHGTCLQRMERVMEGWAARPQQQTAAPDQGTAATSSLVQVLAAPLWSRTRHLLAYIMSLVPFGSFVLMQLVFFLGLNKMEWWETAPVSSEDKESDLDSEEAVTKAVQAQSRAHLMTRGAKRFRESIVDRREEARAAGGETPGTAAARASGANYSAPVAQLHRKRYVSEAKGRRLLRVLTITLMAVMAHLTLGLRYFVVMHAVLFLLFIVARPLCSLQRFVFLFSMIWRGCILAFLVVGLAGSVASDVLSVRHAILAKTNEVVTGRSGELLLKSMSGIAEVPQAGSASFARCGSPPDMLACLYLVPTDPEKLCVTSTAPSLSTEQTPVTATSEIKNQPNGEAVVDDPNDLKTFLITKLQQGVLQQLYVLLDKANMTQSAVQFLDYMQGTTGTTTQANEEVGGDSLPLSSSSFLSWVSRVLKEENERDSNVFDNSTQGETASLLQQRRKGGEAIPDTNYEYFLFDSKTKHKINERTAPTAAATRPVKNASAENLNTAEQPDVASSTDWISASQTVLAKAMPIVELVINLLIRFSHNVLEFFDSLYACTLFFVLFRYLISLDHTVLYYLIAKLLRALEPRHGERHARRIERDITTSFITLLQSFWHLAWYHFCCSFISFTVLGLPTPFFFGVVSVLLALFPLMPKACCPPTVAFLYFFYQNMVVHHRHLAGVFAAMVPPREPLLASLYPLVHQYSRITYLVAAAPALLDARAVALLVAGYLESRDDWLLCVTRGLGGGGTFRTDTEDFELDQYQPLVVGVALVLGFVAYGTSGIIIGPLTLIAAKAVYDNWDIACGQRQEREEKEPRAVRRRRVQQKDN